MINYYNTVGDYINLINFSSTSEFNVAKLNLMDDILDAKPGAKLEVTIEKRLKFYDKFSNLLVQIDDYVPPKVQRQLDTVYRDLNPQEYLQLYLFLTLPYLLQIFQHEFLDLVNLKKHQHAYFAFEMIFENLKEVSE